MIKPVFAMIMKDPERLVNPVWDFISKKVATDAFIYPPIDLSKFINISRYNTENTVVFICNYLWMLVELDSYIIGCYDSNNKTVSAIETLSNNTKIYMFCNENDMLEYINYGDFKEARPVMEIDLNLKPVHGVPLPDHPYTDFWMDRSLNQMNVKPISPTIYVPNEYLEGLFSNIQIERILFSFDSQIHHYTIKKMFNNTRCRVIEMSFYNCDDEYMLTSSPFSEIDFRYRDGDNFTGASYISIIYKRESTGYVDTSKYYIVI